MRKIFEQIFNKRYSSDQYTERHTISLVKKMQITNTRRYPYVPVRMAKIKLTIKNDVEISGPSGTLTHV